MAVFVLDRHKKPLDPCSEKRARQLLERGRARVHKLKPFTIRIVDRLFENSCVNGVAVKIDPGSRETGIAVVREDGDGAHALAFINLRHRGLVIRKKLEQRAAYRRRRRSSNLRYRAPRFNNRRRPEGWLAPSLRHRVDSTVAWMRRLCRIAPVRRISMELVKFDMQAMQNPEISGVEYQQGELAGYEVREYLLEKWGRKCAYCGKENVPLEIEHITAKSVGGSNRVSNLTLACHDCNQAKGNMPVEAFLKNRPEALDRIRRQAKQPLKDAAAVNATRWELYRELQVFGLPVETASGGRTKWNRTRLHVPKAHWLDALCVGSVDAVSGIGKPVLEIACTGRGSHQRTRVDRNGFPRGFCLRQKRVHGFATGDLAAAVVPRGKHAGKHVGRLAVRENGSFCVAAADGKHDGISWRHCRLLQRADGYGYGHLLGNVNQENFGGSVSSPA